MCVLLPPPKHCGLCIAAGGDPHLGGDDWDAVIVDWLIREHLGGGGAATKGGNRHGASSKSSVGTSGLGPSVDLSDGAIRANLRKLAEAAKVGLSHNQEAVLRWAPWLWGGHEEHA